MDHQATVEALIFQCIEALNRQLPPEEKVAATAQTVLVGEGGRLDSLALITLMVSLEDTLTEKGMTFSLVDGMMDEGNAGHYHTVKSLAAFIAGSDAG